MITLINKWCPIPIPWSQLGRTFCFFVSENRHQIGANSQSTNPSKWRWENFQQFLKGFFEKRSFFERYPFFLCETKNTSALLCPHLAKPLGVRGLSVKFLWFFAKVKLSKRNTFFWGWLVQRLSENLNTFFLYNDWVWLVLNLPQHGFFCKTTGFGLFWA